MKTFDEALKSVVAVMLPSEDHRAETERICASALRFNSLATEVRDHPNAQLMLSAYYENVMGALNSDCDPIIAVNTLRNALFSAFMNGITVGIEMEKQEFEVKS